MRLLRIFTALVALLIPFTLACGPSLAEQVVAAGPIEIIAPFARATLPNSPTGGVYFTLRNTGSTDDRLLSASSPIAGEIQMHAMSIENNVASMRELTDGIAVPAGGTLTLLPSGTHLMLTHLTEPLVKGATLSVTVVFEHAGSVTLSVPIGSIAAKSAP